MNDIYEEDISWNLFVHQYYWVLVLLIVLAFVLVGLLLWYIRHCRREPRYDYTALADDSFLQERMEMDRKLVRDSDRNMSTICCQYYLRGSNRYVFLQHLPEMGSRIGKNWFLVRDTTTKTERLMTMTPVVESCPIKYNSQARQVLLELFLAIQHPYIYPVLDIDRKIIMEQEYVLAVLPFNNEGTLKDIIYQSHCQDDWKDKYHFHGYGMSAAQIQRLGCQILEALLFLKDQKFPPFLHLHSGNVVVQNGVARISGLENTLFGYSSRFLTLVPKRLHDNKEAIEVMSFAHLIYEMASGYELTTCQPTEKNYADIEHSPLVLDVLKFLFEQGRYRYPSLRQVANLEFFRHIDLRELRSLTPAPSIKARLSAAALSLLKDVKRSQRSKKRSKYPQSVSGVETASVYSQQSCSSEGSSKRLSRKKKKKSTIDFPQLIDSQHSGHLMNTLPLSEVETSAGSDIPVVVTVNSNQAAGNFNPGRVELDPDQMLAHSLLLQDIQKGFQLQRAERTDDPLV